MVYYSVLGDENVFSHEEWRYSMVEGLLLRISVVGFHVKTEKSQDVCQG